MMTKHIYFKQLSSEKEQQKNSKKNLDRSTKPRNRKRKMSLSELSTSTCAKMAGKKPKIVVENRAKIKPLTSDCSRIELTKVLALDCEYVGGGFDGREDILARVSIVNELGMCMYDKYVTPTEKVTDYRTSVSGIRPRNLGNNAEKCSKVRSEVNNMIADRIVVGHALHNDFRVLKLSHPRRLTRDTAKYRHLKGMTKTFGSPSLKQLASSVLGIQIQHGEHNSIIDAKVAMQLYLLNRKKWESDISRYRGKKA